MKFSREKIAGFTLIEMIVSLAVFSIVVTTAVGAMLVLIATNQRLQAEQSVMTNLAFALDTMTREMRTGFGYNCVSHPTDNGAGPGAVFAAGGSSHDAIVNTLDCPNASTQAFSGVSFFEGGDSITGSANRILYFYNENDRTIYRKVGNGTPQSIVSSGLYIDNTDFIVTGSTTGDNAQPTITVYIEAREKDVANDKVYRLQTTVTQRILDL